jgi:hypothetical protein
MPGFGKNLQSVLRRNKVAGAQRGIRLNIDNCHAKNIFPVACAVRNELFAIGEGALQVGVTGAVVCARPFDVGPDIDTCLARRAQRSAELGRCCLKGPGRQRYWVTCSPTCPRS